MIIKFTVQPLIHSPPSCPKADGMADNPCACAIPMVFFVARKMLEETFTLPQIVLRPPQTLHRLFRAISTSTLMSFATLRPNSSSALGIILSVAEEIPHLLVACGPFVSRKNTASPFNEHAHEIDSSLTNCHLHRRDHLALVQPSSASRLLSTLFALVR